MGQIISVEKSQDFICYATPGLVEKRNILNITYHGGTYGTGGHGFLGFKLEEKNKRQSEWLVCSIRGASDWFSVNERPLMDIPRWMNKKALVGWSGHGERWDEFKPMVINQLIKSFTCLQSSCKLHIGDICLELKEDYRLRANFFGNNQYRKFKKYDDLRKAWVFVKKKSFFVY